MTQRTLLDRLLHRDLSNPEHLTNLHLHYDISYPPNGSSFFTSSPSDVLLKPKDPKVHKELKMEQVLQKKLRWMTLGGQYDWTKKVYPAEAPPEFPVDIADLVRGTFPRMLDPQAAIVNIYSPGDTLSLHRDVSEEVNKTLVSISLGCDSLFLVAVEDEEEESGFKHAVIRLQSGDGLIMTDEGRFAWHGVPNIFPDTCPSFLADWPNDYTGPDGPLPQWHSWMKNKRINLNIRQMRETLNPKYD
jgi:alkylated DNA repair protein alkB family protein 1